MAGLVDRVRRRRRRRPAGDVLTGREGRTGLSDAELPDQPPKATGGNWGPPPRRWRSLP